MWSIRCFDGAPARTLALLGVALLGVAAGAPRAGAETAGATVLGPVYPIAEPDLLAHVHQRLARMQADGSLARLQGEIVRRERAAIEQPRPIDGLTSGPRARTHWFDPTVTVTENVLDQTGRVVVPAGSRRNPLDVVQWPRQLLLFDARDARQLAIADALRRRRGPSLRLVLVGGSYLELMKRWRTRVYYDQRGMLVRQLGIVQVPALVVQDGRRLRIDALPVPAAGGGRLP